MNPKPLRTRIGVPEKGESPAASPTTAMDAGEPDHTMALEDAAESQPGASQSPKPKRKPRKAKS